MNKLFSFVAVATLFVSFGLTELNAQTSLNEGMIKMELTDIKSDDPAMGAQLGMMKGSTTTVYFNDKKSLTQMDMMGGMMEMSVMSDVKTKAGFLLFKMDMLGQKVKVNITEEDVKTREADNAMADITVEYDESDTKEVAGYKCYKATITSPGLQGGAITAYITDEITASADIIQGITADKIKGFPLEYVMGAQGISMVYTTVEIKTEIDKSVFDVNTDGYEEQTMEEFTKTMGAMGGMGF